MFSRTDIERRIAAIEKRQRKNAQDIHDILCRITIHALENSGDVSLFDRLFGAVKGADRRAIARWIHDFTPARLSKDGKFSLNKSKFKEMQGVTFEDLLKVTPWYEYVPSAREVARTFDIEWKVQLLLAQCEKHKNEGREVKNDDFVPFLQDALAKYRLSREVGTQETFRLAA